jgi:hypothetical protein
MHTSSKSTKPEGRGRGATLEGREGERPERVERGAEACPQQATFKRRALMHTSSKSTNAERQQAKGGIEGEKRENRG